MNTGRKVIRVIRITILACLVIFFIVKQLTTTPNSAKIAQQFLSIDDPLPAGWEYAGGMDVGLVKNCTIKNAGTSDRVVVALYAEPPSKKRVKAKDMATNSLTGKSTIESSGQDVIAGQTMYYNRGMRHMGKMDIPFQMGYLNTPSGRLVTIEVFEPSVKTYDPQVVKPILDHIKGFKI
ncbi:MAG TPA: hypothetical protein V6D22_23510 [Candidatus Obscuribacterales bacterium]